MNKKDETFNFLDNTKKWLSYKNLTIDDVWKFLVNGTYITKEMFEKKANVEYHPWSDSNEIYPNIMLIGENWLMIWVSLPRSVVATGCINEFWKFIPLPFEIPKDCIGYEPYNPYPFNKVENPWGNYSDDYVPISFLEKINDEYLKKESEDTERILNEACWSAIYDGEPFDF